MLSRQKVCGYFTRCLHLNMNFYMKRPQNEEKKKDWSITRYADIKLIYLFDTPEARAYKLYALSIEQRSLVILGNC